MIQEALTAGVEKKHEALLANIAKRHRVGSFMHVVFYSATAIAGLALIILLLNIFNAAFGFVLLENEIQPYELVESGDLNEAPPEKLIEDTRRQPFKGSDSKV